MSLSSNESLADHDVKIISTVYLPGPSRAHAASTHMQETRGKPTGCPRSAFITHVHYSKMKAQRQPNIILYRLVKPFDKPPVPLRKLYPSHFAPTYNSGPPRNVTSITTNDPPHTEHRKPSSQDPFSEAHADRLKHHSLHPGSQVTTKHFNSSPVRENAIANPPPAPGGYIFSTHNISKKPAHPVPERGRFDLYVVIQLKKFDDRR
ncbi:MAG: hypothetical protein L6R36_003068 [Xanthoria steineri]|nr:MAG: hypothetical protein L6R36_003068 [Xanthoria steineri]